MRKILFMLLLCLLASSAITQPITMERQVLSTAGVSTRNSDIIISWTIGEAHATRLQNQQNILTQGFQQPVCDSLRAVCRDTSVQLTGGGLVQLSGEMLNNNSYAQCGLKTLTASPDLLNCSDLTGDNTVILTITDQNNNSSTCSSTVTVEDAENLCSRCSNLTAVCRDISVMLNSYGTICIDSSHIDNGSSSDCSIESMALSHSCFTCSETGLNQVTLTVTDREDGVSTCRSNVTVYDGTPPMASCLNQTVSLDQSGIALIDASDIDLNSSDNCGIFSYRVDIDTLSCAQKGVDNMITLTVTDSSLNSSSCTARVRVSDLLPPTIICPASDTINCGANFACNIMVSDNCGGSTYTQIAGLPCNAVFPDGTTVMGFRATDAEGLTASCSFTISVFDTSAPLIICPDDTSMTASAASCFKIVNYAIPFAGDDCSTMSVVQTTGYQSGSAFPFGSTQNTFRASDVHGNSTSCSFSVTIIPDRALTIQSTVSSLVCHTDKAGQIAVNISGGTAPYSYLWPQGLSALSHQQFHQAELSALAITDACGKESSRKIAVGNALVWVNAKHILLDSSGYYKSEYFVGPQRWNNAGAESENGIAPNEDGFIQFSITDRSAGMYYAIGLSSDNPDNDLRTIDYGFYHRNGELIIVESGAWVQRLGQLNIGSDVILAREGSFMVYYLNGIEVRRIAVDASLGLLADLAFLNRNARVEDVSASFCPNALAVDVLTLPVHCGEETGILQSIVRDSTLLPSYSWSSGDTHAAAANLSLGLYSLTVKDLFNRAAQVEAAVQTEVLWSSRQGWSWDADECDLRQTANTGWGNAGLTSFNRLEENTDGQVSFSLTNRSDRKYYVVGFSDQSMNNNLTNVDHGIYYRRGVVYAIENGLFAENLGNVSAGAELSIRIQAGRLDYLIDGEIKRSIPLAGHDDWYVTYLALLRNTLPEKVYASFCGSAFSSEITLADDTISCQQQLGELNPVIAGAGSNSEFVWSTCERTTSLTELEPGAFSLTVTDHPNLAATKSAEVYTPVSWTNMQGMEWNEYHQTFRNITSTGWGNAGATSSNVLEPGVDGSIKWKLTSLSANKMYCFGLSDVSPDHHIHSIMYGLYYRRGIVRVMESRESPHEVHNVPLGSELSIDRSNGFIIFKIDGAPIWILEDAKPEKAYIIDHAVLLRNTFMEDVYATFCGTGNILAEVPIEPGYSECGENTGILVAPVPTDGTPPYSYLWSNGSSSAALTNLATGSYTLSIVDADNSRSEQNGYVLTTPEWSALQGVQWVQSKGTYQKHLATSGSNANMFSSNYLPAGSAGLLAYSISQVNRTKYYGIGLSNKDDGTHINSLDHCFWHARGSTFVFENGRRVLSLGSTPASDKFKIEVTADLIKYYHNGLVVHETGISPKDLYVDVAMHSSGTCLEDVTVSFCHASPAKAAIEELQREFLLIPNPNNGLFSVHFQSSEADYAEMRLFDALGKLVYTGSFPTSIGKNDQRVDVGDLPAGSYYLIIQGQKGLHLADKFLIH